MKSYDQFVNESIVGKLAGFAGRAARGAKKLGGKAANLAGKAAANRHVRTAGSGLRGGLAGLKSYGRTGPVTKAADKGSGFKAGTPGAGLLGTAGKGINQNLKGFQKGTTTGAKHVPGKQISGPTTTPAQRSAGGGVAKSTGGGGVQKTSGGGGVQKTSGGVQSTKPNTFTSRLRQKVTDKVKTKIKKTIGYEGDRDKAAALKKAGRAIQKDVARPKLPAGKPTSGSLPPAKPKTLPSSGGAKPSGGSTPPQSGGGKPTGGSTPQRKDLSKSGGGQTIDVKATPVGKKPTASAGKKPATGSKKTGKAAGKKPSLDDLIKSVRGEKGKKPGTTGPTQGRNEKVDKGTTGPTSGKKPTIAGKKPLGTTGPTSGKMPDKTGTKGAGGKLIRKPSGKPNVSKQLGDAAKGVAAKAGAKIGDAVKSGAQKAGSAIKKKAGDTAKSVGNKIMDKVKDATKKTPMASEKDGGYTGGGRTVRLPSNTSKKSDKAPVINKGEKGGALVKAQSSSLKTTNKSSSSTGSKDSYPSKKERIAAHKKKVANLKAKGVKLREELSFWREEFIWETDKKYPDKVKQIKPMSGKNTIIINPEDESAKYSGR